MYRKIVFFPPIKRRNHKLVVQTQLLVSAISVHRQPSMIEKWFFW